MEVACYPKTFWNWDRKKPLYMGEFLHIQHFVEADPYSALFGRRGVSRPQRGDGAGQGDGLGRCRSRAIGPRGFRGCVRGRCWKPGRSPATTTRDTWRSSGRMRRTRPSCVSMTADSTPASRSDRTHSTCITTHRPRPGCNARGNWLAAGRSTTRGRGISNWGPAGWTPFEIRLPDAQGGGAGDGG